MSERKPCEACCGRGYVIVGAGLAALENQYPGLPIREMEQRGWFGDVGNGEDVARCDASFLRFWGVTTHADVPIALKESA